jgi:bifunctional pyridoxal-dependent enzyme with beta-cystathionase and maltose regulon repressor activities
MIRKLDAKYHLQNKSCPINGSIDERKFEKAKTIIDLALTKMPLDKFGYYSLVEPLQKDTTKWVKKQHKY